MKQVYTLILFMPFYAFSGTCDYPDQLDSAGRRCGKRAASVKAGGRLGGVGSSPVRESKGGYKGLSLQDQDRQIKERKRRMKKLSPKVASVHTEDRNPAWATGKPDWWIDREKKIRILNLLKKSPGQCFEDLKINTALGFEPNKPLSQLAKQGYLIKCSEGSFKWKKLY